jgi:leucyl-tRNA synthetase
MADTSVPKAMEGLKISKTKELKGTEKRDALRAYEMKCQAAWEEAGYFNADAPTTSEIPLHSISAAELREKYPKWFGTIAYPYMNGMLHIGHGFTFSKVEFTAGWERMNGRRVLWPQGYHCTGLPIKVCADKLTAEVKMFGQEFENYKEDEEPVVESENKPPPKGAKKEDVTKFSATKGKMNAKTVKAKYQFQIMKTMGIPIQEIHRFSDVSVTVTSSRCLF